MLVKQHVRYVRKKIVVGEHNREVKARQTPTLNKNVMKMKEVTAPQKSVLQFTAQPEKVVPL
jgi:hypothetical protein